MSARHQPSLAELAGALRELHAPIARIELAASRLAREDMPPRARQLATTIREAVAELDERLDATARQGLPALQRPSQKIGNALEAWKMRMRPVLAARGLALETSVDEDLAIDPVTMRRGLNALTRLALDAAGSGPLHLDLSHVDGALRMQARWHRADTAPGFAADAARRNAAATGGRLDHDPSGATLWLPVSPAASAE